MQRRGLKGDELAPRQRSVRPTCGQNWKTKTLEKIKNFVENLARQHDL